MRPSHGVRYGAQKNPIYRVGVRLVRVVKTADHGGEKDAKPELKISFQGKPHDHELCTPKLATDFQWVFHHSFMRTEARPPFGGTIMTQYAFLGRHEGVNSSSDFYDGGHRSERSQLRC
jgi:hypothetical protein